MLGDDDRALLRHLGYGFVPDVPLVEHDPRSAAEVLDRLLAMSTVVAVADGLDAVTAQHLLDGWDVRHALTEDEVDYLADAEEGVHVEDAARSLHVEAVAVLAWALGLGPEPPLDEPITATPAPEKLVVPETPELRPTDELRRALARYDAMAWALRDDPELAVGAAPGAVDPYVVHERRGALQWVFTLPRPALDRR